MKIIQQHVHGRLFSANGRRALLLMNATPETETTSSFYLCFALVVQGSEEHILPALVKNDWGNERRGLDVYAWLEEEGHHFPRSEIFGFDPDGTETQCFLRALEFVTRLPCYLFQSKNAAVVEGVLLNAILLPDESASRPYQTQQPAHLARPLAAAAVSWWRVHPDITTFDFL